MKEREKKAVSTNEMERILVYWESNGVILTVVTSQFNRGDFN